MSDFDASKIPEWIGGYKILDLIGKGGMGSVYLAYQSSLGRLDALKIIRPSLLREEQVVERFKREMHTIGQLRHPNVLFAFGAGSENGIHYLAMELIRGLDAQVLLDTRMTLRFEDAVEIVRQALCGIGNAASKGITHRDVKPANLMVDVEGVVKVADLGVARLASSANGSSDLTKEVIIGTPDFVSPEQARGEAVLTAASDIYSLGCTLYYLISGFKPFDGHGFDTGMKKVHAHMNVEPNPITDYCPDLPPGLVELIGRMMKKDPIERGNDPDALAAELLPFAKGADLVSLVGDHPDLPPEQPETIFDLAPPTTRIPRPMGPPPVRKKRIVWGAAVTMIAAAAVSIGFYLSSDRNKSGANSGEIEVPHFQSKGAGGGAEEEWQSINFKQSALRSFGEVMNPPVRAVVDDRLVFEAPEPTFLELGSLDSADFRLIIRFRQPMVMGGYGVYIAGSDGLPCHTVTVERGLIKAGHRDPPNLVFSRLEWDEETGNTYRSLPVDKDSIRSMNDEYRITVEFRGGILKSAIVNGNVLSFDPDLTGFEKVSGAITFGLHGDATICSCTSPVIIVYKPTEEVIP